MPSGPDARVKITEQYARTVARDAFLWAWPLVNVMNRRAINAKVPQPVISGGAPAAPLNRLSMITEYIAPDERLVACPNQDVVYGGGPLALDLSPVVIQVPDFDNRFWVYQIVDSRTDSFASLGKMYASRPGFYLFVGPGWQGEIPKGIAKVFRSTTTTGYVIPRVFMDDTAEDRAAIQPVINQINMYPLGEFDGSMKTVDWKNIPQVAGEGGDKETPWVPPATFFDTLPSALADAPPLAGEESRYAQVLALLRAAKSDAALRKAMDEEVAKADAELIAPLFEFRNWGVQLPFNWSTTSNNAAFGTDYFTRTAVAKSNIFVNAPNETKYFYQDLDAGGARLNGSKRYVVTFPKDQTPPVNGFWSLTLYNAHHFFAPNVIKRYSVGTKNTDLKLAADGSLTIYVQSDTSTDPVQRTNWLPAPKGDFSLYLRAYWPKTPIIDGSWAPPPVQKTG
ncbi:DUF1254 domain-containing protein [Mesorhizobium sp. M6A.T.Ce.TU.016.01.1.1]|uniref:DUF1254 domain-containing protein n=1 Tax=Mesorhizobium sp. M6A.T.Ce.TU.016.01.1.1 TaxID=2496783 RepID=UPI000FCA7F82|nr:DUF1254 domain-containing protein [Mesorhizobium sp. M6A.T.Ce.TU.016.01.1.1]RUU28507.1 DUF1254 domain-containing protein [Mesorhizobium sp. M6A.T.Ce.TU.016.01.1.1]